MMGTRLQLFLTTYFVNCFMTSAQLHNLTPAKTVQSSALEEVEVRDNLRNLFESVAKDETKEGHVYRTALKHEIVKDQQAFNSLKDDVWLARNMNAFKKKRSRDGMNGDSKIMLTKRETMEKKAVSDYPKVKTTYNPIIHDISHHEAMKKLKELWVRQRDYLKIVKQVADEVKNVTGHKIRQFGWVYNDTEERIEKFIRVLSDEPWKNSDDMKEALDGKILSVIQIHTWNCFEKCLDDYYEFLPKDEYEKRYREAVEAARQDLKSREEEIKLLVKGSTTPSNQCGA